MAKEPTGALRAREIKYHRAFMKQHRVAVLYSYEPNQLSHVINDRTGQRFQATPKIVDAIENTAYKWSVFLGALCRDEKGEDYMKCLQVDTPDYYLHRELQDVLQEHHKKLLNGCNQNHLINAVWLGSPYGKDWLESEAAYLFDKFGAWDHEPRILETPQG